MRSADTTTCRDMQVNACNTATFFVGYQGGVLPPAGHTQRNQANATAGGPRQSLTSEIRLTPLQLLQTNPQIPATGACVGLCMQLGRSQPASALTRALTSAQHACNDMTTISAQQHSTALLPCKRKCWIILSHAPSHRAPGTKNLRVRLSRGYLYQQYPQ